jgi:radical SAM protein with 4Fe4S-binding SPASM domain
MPCEELAYSELAERLIANLGGRRELLSAMIGLTDRCNLRCVHCFVHDAARDRELRARELTTQQWFQIFDKLADAGCLSLTWTGGEILVRDDFAELYRYAKQKGFLITLMTNGTLLTPEIVELLQEWYPLYLDISLYGLSAEMYQQVTDNGGAFDSVMRGIELLQRAGVPFRLKTIAMTVTRHQVAAMYGFAAEQGVTFRHDGVLVPARHGADISHLRLPPAELVAMDALHPDGAEDLKRLQKRFVDFVAAHPTGRATFLYTCGAGLHSCYVDPYGWMGLCQLNRPGVYGLSSGSFWEGWKRLEEVRQTPVTKDFECLHCTVSGLCQRCPVFSRLENGDPETVVDYACSVAHLRAARLGFDLAEAGLNAEPITA